MENKKFTEIYTDLASVDCSSFTEKKKDLTYLSWSHAWNAVASRYDANYSVVRFDGKPYFFDESLGYYVETQVTIEGNIRTMQLFVMDGANNAMTNHSYNYTTKFGEKSVEKATMFEINTAIMRCLTKNLALFGLGINIYAGEDLPLIDADGNATEKKIAPKASNDPIKSTPTGGPAKNWLNFPQLKKAIEGGTDTDVLLTQWIIDNKYDLSGDMKKCIRTYCDSGVLVAPEWKK